MKYKKGRKKKQQIKKKQPKGGGEGRTESQAMRSRAEEQHWELSTRTARAGYGHIPRLRPGHGHSPTALPVMGISQGRCQGSLRAIPGLGAAGTAGHSPCAPRCCPSTAQEWPQSPPAWRTLPGPGCSPGATERSPGAGDGTRYRHTTRTGGWLCPRLASAGDCPAAACAASP